MYVLYLFKLPSHQPLNRLSMWQTANLRFQEDVLRLVELTEDIKRDRRERIREIQIERDIAERRRQPLALPAPPWDEERVVEREIIYDRGPLPPRRYR
jgi:hypothetical protein